MEGNLLLITLGGGGCKKSSTGWVNHSAMIYQYIFMGGKYPDEKYG